jgi:hypothetical protein
VWREHPTPFHLSIDIHLYLTAVITRWSGLPLTTFWDPVVFVILIYEHGLPSLPRSATQLHCALLNLKVIILIYILVHGGHVFLANFIDPFVTNDEGCSHCSHCETACIRLALQVSILTAGVLYSSEPPHYVSRAVVPAAPQSDMSRF